ncbi:lysophospholipid acyltransferase family protein [Nocardioides bruguierae]|uniref:lysophospholipid acyltransferase family protein n=1 Tax=Nocardioides bruguierae TaxID=2945102 RepID=UPI002020389A|nr:lysophospholipid acyltransferase family protein [Nocardioides bruguierae]MCL8023839.1 acyltransferase family protein [Nocardioides bruguierae]
MGDAEVIPIGTRGRPGRGTGSTTPSSASRGLAGGARRPAAQRSPEPPEQPEEISDAADAQDGATDAGAHPGWTDEDSIGGGAAGPAADATTSSTTSSTTTADRHPLGNVSPAELMNALTGAAKEVFGPEWEEELARLLAFVRRRLTGDYAVDEYGFDPEVTERFFLTALRPVAQKWFRIEVRGIENIPTDSGALIVSNHSGTLPWDGLMTMVTVHDRTGRFVRPLGADLVFRTPVVAQLARMGGATLACSEDADRMLAGGELVGVWPEGFKGLGKPYAERYKLQRFGRGGFVSAALRTRTPIVPLSVVGAEEIYPMLSSMPTLARVLGVPYFPVTPLFPWLGPLGMVPLPSKWLMEFGEPVRTDELEDGAADDPMLVFDVTDQVRESIQQTLYRLLMERKSVFG